ncbi:hypothetical protein N7532_004443 [Penicillium argentinense]|uniref:Cell cycle inhibitor Nif1 n=1 Tax=Penicillium argentinense TaxID=1131581 RepID=A0A9W9FPD7_9EURO|nr:uncharacterized protein N7532_004443 [Penicillium argentinense]KAJ5103914.1 hypothetical protein N7532_004443 [Penicillium argentinense]
MAAWRGNLGDCRSNSHDTLRSGIPSPRIEHYDGEVPPALSPWMRPIPRPPTRRVAPWRSPHEPPAPSSVARSLSHGRPRYFRGNSNESQNDGLARRPTQKNTLPEVEEPKYRPVSEHPRFSSVSHASSSGDFQDDDSTPRSTMLQTSPSGYGMPRADSPEEDASLAGDTSVGMAVANPSRDNSTDSVSRLHIPRTLAPPHSPNSRPSSSARVMHPERESSDDDYSSSNGGSTFSKPRKLSSSSAVSLPYSPMSTYPARPQPRSPSMSSETSNGYLPRPSFNFSRPLSRSSTSLSAPGPSATSEPTTAPQAQQSRHMHRSSKPTPILLPLATDEAGSYPPQEGEPSSAVSSYTYAKYALPRGRELSRDSVVFAGLQTPHFEWNEPLFENSPPRRSEEPLRSTRTPPPPARNETENSPKPHSMHEVPASQSKRAVPVPESPPKPPPTAAAPVTPVTPPRPCTESTKPKNNEKDETVSSADSASTLRPQTANTQSSSKTLSADDHVSMGIDLHEKGSLNESTYHMRIAAKQNHPTGMLLYALACRHGWGMRSNQQEGVRWLRKAVDSVGLEMLENPDAPGASKAKELQKAYRAQFALSIYELGVSYLNGWGINQDKPLALRCFEIAGQWGDVDAMAEAGFCYAEGVGCKKDMKKAARFYRQAEDNGMSMVGNSWIYKDKYMAEDSGKGRSRGRTVSSEKKPRSKSRTRSMFQRKKSAAEA